MKQVKQLLSVAIITTSLSISHTFADNLCKNQNAEACNTAENCRWVKSYKRKDNKVVNAYCRSKNKKKTVVKEKTTKKILEKTPNTLEKLS